jgi:hypothetical protein
MRLGDLVLTLGFDDRMLGRGEKLRGLLLVGLGRRIDDARDEERLDGRRTEEDREDDRGDGRRICEDRLERERSEEDEDGFLAGALNLIFGSLMLRRTLLLLGRLLRERDET